MVHFRFPVPMVASATLPPANLQGLDLALGPHGASVVNPELLARPLCEACPSPRFFAPPPAVLLLAAEQRSVQPRRKSRPVGPAA